MMKEFHGHMKLGDAKGRVPFLGNHNAQLKSLVIWRSVQDQVQGLEVESESMFAYDTHLEAIFREALPLDVLSLQ